MYIRPALKAEALPREKPARKCRDCSKSALDVDLFLAFTPFEAEFLICRKCSQKLIEKRVKKIMEENSNGGS